MKKVVSLLFMLFVSQNIANASVMDWSDIEPYEQYTLAQDISFPGVTSFKQNEKFEVLDIFTGDSNIIYYQMHFNNCTEPGLEAEMILINPSPKDTGHDHSVGVQLEVGCNLGIWIEASDYFSPSLFLDLSGH